MFVDHYARLTTLVGLGCWRVEWVAWDVVGEGAFLSCLSSLLRANPQCGVHPHRLPVCGGGGWGRGTNMDECVGGKRGGHRGESCLSWARVRGGELDIERKGMRPHSRSRVSKQTYVGEGWDRGGGKTEEGGKGKGPNARSSADACKGGFAMGGGVGAWAPRRVGPRAEVIGRGRDGWV